MPTGNETGAYKDEWILGSKTKGGITEADLVNSEKIFHNNDINELSKQFRSSKNKMINNNFQKAIQSGNVYDFFRGKGSYFISSPDYDGHVYGAQMGGAARVYAEESRENSKEFDESFLNFLGNLEVSEEDLNHLLANLSSYCAQKSRGGFTYRFLFENQNGPEWGSVNRYLNEVSKSPFFENVKSQISRHANFLNKKGYKFLSLIFEVL